MLVAFQTLRSVASPFLDYCEVLLPLVHPARMLLPNVYHLGFTVGQTLQRLINHHTQPEIPSPSEISNFIVRLPYMYKDWWWNLVSNDPIHVAVETTLLASVVYMVIISRNKDYRSSERREWLSSHEQEELLEEWKEGRANLAPAKVTVSKPLVVNAYNGRTMDIMIEVDDQLDCVGDNKKVKHIPQQTVVNMATHDFLGMSCNEEVKIASRLALDKYGCGSCGPRGFYGTIDVHLQLEQAIADFTETHGAIMYSDGASAVTSTIAAFAKRGDLLVVDDGVYEPIVTGVTLSRANVEWFVHNDMVRHKTYLFALVSGCSQLQCLVRPS
jgi:serine palmitoyltransferase